MTSRESARHARSPSDKQVEAIVVKTLETTPRGKTPWSTRFMAKAGVSHTMVGRIWRTFRLQPHRAESFKISPDRQLVEKIREVVGLYVAPPANAVVFSVDEKSQIQALQRAQPILPMDFGQPERLTHNYVRHGTPGSVRRAQCHEWRGDRPMQPATPGTGFRRVSAPDRIGRRAHARHPRHPRQPSAHRAPPVQRGLLRHPRVHFHFTPTWPRGSIWWSGSLDCGRRKRSSVDRTRAFRSGAPPSSRTWRPITTAAHRSDG